MKLRIMIILGIAILVSGCSFETARITPGKEYIEVGADGVEKDAIGPPMIEVTKFGLFPDSEESFIDTVFGGGDYLTVNGKRKADVDSQAQLIEIFKMAFQAGATSVVP